MASELGLQKGAVRIWCLFYCGASYRGNRCFQHHRHCHSGIGMETARVLSLRGATVIIPARSKESGEKVKEKIVEQVADAKIEVMELDLSSLASVRSFAAAFLSSNKPLNLLINNAGIFGCPFQLSEDGIELQFATNHIGHFLLTNLLLDKSHKMKATARESGTEGRIVVVASQTHSTTYKSGIRSENINNPSWYGRFKAYGQSKLANILHAKELARRLQASKLIVSLERSHMKSSSLKRSPCLSHA